jgi:hypothetical protein
LTRPQVGDFEVAIGALSAWDYFFDHEFFRVCSKWLSNVYLQERLASSFFKSCKSIVWSSAYKYPYYLPWSFVNQFLSPMLPLNVIPKGADLIASL